MGTIRVRLDIPEDFYNKAEYVFNIFSDAWGIPIQILKGDNTLNGREDIVYTSKCHQLKQNEAVSIPFHQQLYENRKGCGIVKLGGNLLWGHPSEGKRTDLIAGTFRLLTFIDEQDVKAEDRDRKGIFFINALPVARRAIAKYPIIESHSNYLFRELLLRKPNLKYAVLPRWPKGKKYVISLTHDTDAADLGAPYEIITNLTKFLLRREKMYLDMAIKGLEYIGNGRKNPLFGFPLSWVWDG